MADIVYNYKSYLVLDTGKELIVKDSKGKYENHAHFYRKTDKKGNIKLETAKTCIKLCDNKRLDIRNSYMLDAVIRLTIDEDYRENLKRKKAKKKEKYINVQKGT